MKFSAIPGYEALKGRLIQAANAGQVAHAQLFAGSEGGFGLMLALAYAQYLNCENRSESDSCGSCISCSKSQKFIHPDFHYLFPLAKSKKIDSDELNASIPMFREFLGETPFGTLNDWAELANYENRAPLINIRAVRETMQGLQLKAFEAKYKIQIIWLPETMRSEGANSFLKLLEEPPEFTIFLLVSDQPERLLPTIISRVQRITVPVPSEAQMVQFLSEKTEESENRLQMAASLAEGSLQLAFSLLNEKEDDYHKFYMDWQRACYKEDSAGMIVLSEHFHELGRELQKTFLKYSLEKTRKAFVLSGMGGEILNIQDQEKIDLGNLGRILNQDIVATMMEEMNKAWVHIDRNSAAKMVFFDTSMAIAGGFKKQKTA